MATFTYQLVGNGLSPRRLLGNLRIRSKRIIMESILESFIRDSASAEDVAVIPLIQRAALVLIVSQILAWHYIHYAKVLANKRKFAPVLVGLAVTTFLVITVVKTSLALSLGLVGALSIIRFRTPVKEAEELVYLFVAIAIGLGVGAERTVATLVVVAILLIYSAVVVRIGPTRRFNRSLIQIHIPSAKAGGEGGDALLKLVIETVNQFAENVDLRRVDTHEGEFNANLLADTRSIDGVGALLGGLRDSLPGATISVIDREILE